MVENEKSSSIAGSFLLLEEVWDKWDEKGMVLFSLTLQIILCVLGRHRKYKIKNSFKNILWFAYLGADWIAIATLSKLSGSHAESTATNGLRAYWAPLLLVHLGGPNTITAYAFEDNKLWISHVITLVVKVIFVIYIVCLSWTFSWLSVFTLPLILVGIIKYVEKILCLQLNNSLTTKPIISNMFNLQGYSDPNENRTLDRLHAENPNILSGFLLFTIMRPEVNDFLFSENISDVGTRIRAYVRETTGIDETSAFQFVRRYLGSGRGEDVFEIIFIQLGFLFDVVYTKASLIYTKLGCFFRLTSFTSFFSVLLLFSINIIKKPKFHESRIDIAITGILLSGAIAQELYEAWIMLSSDWAVLVAEFHHNWLIRKMFKVTSKYFPCILSRRKRRLNYMGQFDLLEYCWRHKSHGFLSKITIGSEIIEVWHKWRLTKFVDVPPLLQDVKTYSYFLYGTFLSQNSLKRTRGEMALQNYQQFQELKWSIELEFDHSIIIWHLATSVCYLEEHNHAHEAMKISKRVSDYMMYLLVMCPALIFSEHSKSFWLDHAYDKFKELVSPAIDVSHAAFILLSNRYNVHEEELEPRERTFENLDKDVLQLAKFLRESYNKWNMIRDVWIEMLLCAAVSSWYMNHVKQLGQGIELFSFIWLLADTAILHKFFEM